MGANSPALSVRRWAEAAITRRWPGARLARLEPLAPDASSRQFCRATIEPASPDRPSSAVVMGLGADELPRYVRTLWPQIQPPPEGLFVNVQRLMAALGLAVPEIYIAATAERFLLVEDVGDVSLFEACAAAPTRTPALYRMALDQLLILHGGAGRLSGEEGPALRLAYDRQLFRWEMAEFEREGITRLGLTPSSSRAAALTRELDDLAARLDRLPRVPSHRDYHGGNLFIQDRPGATELRIIDFQDALMAPAGQDLAVLLTTRDTSKLISPRLEAELLEYYFDRAPPASLDGPSRDRFISAYRLCVLQHALKVIGRFAWLEAAGKPGYAAYIPVAVAQGRRMVAEEPGFETLRALLAPV